MKNTASRSLAIIGLALFTACAAAAGIYTNRPWFHQSDHIGVAQASAAIIFGFPSAVFAVAAVMVGLRAAEASEAQAIAARAQADAANAQTRMIEAQMRETLRPVLNIRQAALRENADFNSLLPPMELHNVGPGTAMRVQVVLDFNEGKKTAMFLSLRSAVVPPGASISLPVLVKGPNFHMMDQVVIAYESIAGHRFSSTLQRGELGESHTYEDDPAFSDPLIFREMTVVSL